MEYLTDVKYVPYVSKATGTFLFNLQYLQFVHVHK